MSYTVLYQTIHRHITTHIELVTNQLETAMNADFFQLSGVKLLTKLFVSVLTFFATIFELVRYVGTYGWTEIVRP